MSNTSAKHVFEDKDYTRIRDMDSSAIFMDMEFRRCSFNNCVLSNTSDPALRSTFQGIHLVNCSDNGSNVGRALIEDCVIEDFQTPGLFQVFGAVFKHVVLRGRFGRLMIDNLPLPDSSKNPGYEYKNVEAFRTANEQYYRNVDWALDISQAKFKEFEIRGIPSRLVRRDPETQVVVSRQRLLDGEDWKSLEFQVAPWQMSFQRLLHEGDLDKTLIVPKRHRRFREYMEDLQLLRDAGIAEQD